LTMYNKFGIRLMIRSYFLLSVSSPQPESKSF
jgi:hypothetical protein